jgi:hypothetical protein
MLRTSTQTEGSQCLQNGVPPVISENDVLGSGEFAATDSRNDETGICREVGMNFSTELLGVQTCVF